MKFNLLGNLIKLYSNRFVSHWIILVFDLFVVYFSFYLANLMRYDFTFNSINLVSIVVQSFLVLFVYLIFFLITKSFRSIIRYSGINDSLRIIKATGLATLVLMFLKLIAIWRNDIFSWIPSFSIILIHFFLCLIFLDWSRFIIRMLYHDVINKDPRIHLRVLIYGAGSAGMQTRNALHGDSKYKHEIIAFLDDNPSFINKMLEGVPVISPRKGLSEAYIHRNGVNLMIIAIPGMPLNEKKQIIDRGLELGLNVKVVPSINQWINGELSSNQLKEVRIEDLLEREPIRLETDNIFSEIKDKVILITGGAGSIGKEIVRQLISYQPARLIVLDQAESALYELQFEINESGLTQKKNTIYKVASIRDRFIMEQVFATYRPQYIFHAAAYKHVPLMEDHPYEALMVNVFGTKILADLSVKYKASKFVMVSTDKAVNPTNVMGATKRLAEIYIQSLSNGKTQFITTRFGNVLGSNGSVIPLFREQIKKGGPVTITHKDITRYFMTIPEACNLVLEAGAMGKGGEIFIFDMGSSVKIYDLAHKMIQLSGLTPGKDIHIKETGLRPGEKLKEELLVDDELSLPTYHPKIMRARVRTYDKDHITKILEELSDLVLEGDTFAMIKKIKQIIPEYISNNSIYSSLDKKSK